MAKNAAMLYFRMLLTMVVTLYTSRVVLQTLGVEDYGIYNVVAGFVMMLGFLHGAMSAATQRFLSFELGKKIGKNTSNIFSMSFNIHLLISFFVLILGETVGIWFIRTYMTIPMDRFYSAEWVFHLSLISFMITVISVPYNALIIAHEEMNVFAWVSIIDVLLKLLIVFMLSWFRIDVLILYALLNLIVVLIVFLIYKSYCKSKFIESHFRFYWDRKLFNTMISYTGWNLWGNIAAVLSSQGINVLLNIFFGPSVNAARAISIQVSSALNRFVQSLQVAVNPQIIKSYATQNMTYMHNLVCYGAKYNFFLLLFLSAPIFFNTNLILNTWLINVPDNSSIFVKIIIINVLIDSISAPLMTSAQATGKIKLYQSIVGGILLLNLPISYIILKSGAEPQTVFYVGIATSILAFASRLVILKGLTQLPVTDFLKEVVIRCLIIILIVMLATYIIFIYLFKDINFWIESSVICLFVLLSIAIFGLNYLERQYIINKVKVLYTRIN